MKTHFQRQKQTGLLLQVALVLTITTGLCQSFGIKFNCDDALFQCQCGSSQSYQFSIRVEQCTFFYKWNNYCKPCDDSKPEDVCPIYKQCQECSENAGRCVSCPPGKFGLWCNGECLCQNGGKCNHEDGSCTCPSGFKGIHCEITEILTCRPPLIGDDVTWVDTSYKIGAFAIGHCSKMYTMVRNSSLVCNQDGAWSGMPLLCQPVCPFPNLGAHLTAENNPGATAKMLDIFGQELIKELGFQCHNGYSMVGPQRIRCQKEGKWDQEPPVCKPKILCTDPGKPNNGQRVISDSLDGSFAPGTQVTFQCKNNYFLIGSEVLTCTVTGEWSSSVPNCSLITGCPPPIAPLNGKVEITKTVLTRRSALRIVSRIGISSGSRQQTTPMPPSGHIPPGYSEVHSRALYTCKSIYYALQGTNTRVCLQNGKWSGREPSCEPVCGQASARKRPTIVNGQVANEGRWPWQAAISIRDNDDFTLSCGGSLLSESWIATAAHCVTNKRPLTVKDKDIIRIYLGKHYVNNSLDDAQVVIRSVATIIVHPNYHPRSIDSDIALLKLSEPVELSARVQPVCLPQPKNNVISGDMEEGTVGMVIGWGRTETGLQASELKEAQMPVVNRSKCESDYLSTNQPVTVTDNMFCAGYEDGGIGICDGDSGSPFVVERQTGPSETRWFLEGIVSWGSGCAVPRRYGGFLRMANFVSFVKQYI